MEVLGCVGLAVVLLVLIAGTAHALRERRSPMLFAQATVTQLDRQSATFRLFDGQELELHIREELSQCIHTGDYGRLTYQGNRCREFQKSGTIS